MTSLRLSDMFSLNNNPYWITGVGNNPALLEQTNWSTHTLSPRLGESLWLMFLVLGDNWVGDKL